MHNLCTQVCEIRAKSTRTFFAQISHGLYSNQYIISYKICAQSVPNLCIIWAHFQKSTKLASRQIIFSWKLFYFQYFLLQFNRVSMYVKRMYDFNTYCATVCTFCRYFCSFVIRHHYDQFGYSGQPFLPMRYCADLLKKKLYSNRNAIDISHKIVLHTKINTLKRFDVCPWQSSN